MAESAGMNNLDVLVRAPGYREACRELRLAVQAQAGQANEKALAKARTKDSITAFSKLTRVVEGRHGSWTNRR